MSRTGFIEKFVYLIGMKLTVSSFDAYKKLVIRGAFESLDAKEWVVKTRGYRSGRTCQTRLRMPIIEW